MEAQDEHRSAPHNEIEMQDLRFLEAEGLELLAAFKCIGDDRVRATITRLVKDLAASFETD